MPTYQGRCHCGATEWTADLKDEAHVLCHCNACKLMSGGEFTENQIIPRDALKITKGDFKKYTYKGDSGNEVDCFYCGNCTSNAYHHQKVMGPDTIPAAEIFDKLRPGWLPQTGENSFEGAPPS
ncbi:uncharacterized protein AB675_11669 [Cyphellophora attinorum]|uniref:CENP-V/GFA domain-containing protein n=1 Tax=Cyphellophora attinorum TaxID=1664694 RepID=A0A0N1H2I3_9EURO|nr:uncharacterized protein AB675_11669 [Phialophora attinorum]KPI35453.1 hypothetical protein AB675_11669 [Phialophora attinorum]